MFSVFGVRAGFSMDTSPIFPQGVLVVILLIEGVVGVIVSRACGGCEVGLPLSSVPVAAPQVAEFASQ